ncbi:hypothetical protein ACFE04_006840 [Oxalis oulophora]
MDHPINKNKTSMNDTVSQTQPPPSPILSIEKLLDYTFKDKSLIEDALTHPSFTAGTADSYERLEFIGDAALGLALSNHLYLSYEKLDAGQMSLLRSANVSTEKLARVAVKWGLFDFVTHNSNSLDFKVKEFVQAVEQEDELTIYGGSVKAPKILADIVESVAAAIYIDLNFDLEALWVVFRPFLEPIIGLQDLEQQPQPVTMLFELCQKKGKRIDFRQWRNGDKTIFSVYVDGVFTGSGSSEQRDIAKLKAAKEALDKLNAMKIEKPKVLEWMKGKSEIQEAKHKLHEISLNKKWQRPQYKIEKDEGPPQDRIYVCSVHLATQNGVLCMIGDEKAKLKKAENSAASLMLFSLQQSGLL